MKICAICIFLLVSFIGAFALNQYLDYKNCLCSIATTEHQTKTIDGSVNTTANMVRIYWVHSTKSSIMTLLSIL